MKHFVLLLYLLLSIPHISSPGLSIRVDQSSTESLEPSNVIQTGENQEHTQRPATTKHNTSWFWKLFCCCSQDNNDTKLLTKSFAVESPKTVRNITERYSLDVRRVCNASEACLRKTKCILAEKHSSSQNNRHSEVEILYVSKNIRLVQRKIETLLELLEQYKGPLPHPPSTQLEIKELLEAVYRKLTLAFYRLDHDFPWLKTKNNPFIILGLPKNIGGPFDYSI